MKWIDKDIENLKQIYDKYSISQLAEKFKRSKRAIEIKIVRLGLSVRDFKSEQIECKNCGKLFKDLRSKKRLYCSQACSASKFHTGRKRTDKTKAKISKALKGTISKYKGISRITGKKIKYDTANLPKCKMCSNFCKHYYNTYCSTVCKNKDPEIRHKQSIRMKEKFLKNPKIHPNRLCAGIKESYPEKMLNDYLKILGLKEGLDYIRQYKLGTYYIDFVFPNKNIAIEVDGKRWHDPTSEREIKRENFIKESFTLIRLEASKVVSKYYSDYIKSILSSEAERLSSKQQDEISKFSECSHAPFF